MKTARRALTTLIRNPLRGALLVGVLAVSVGLALIMITVNGAFATRLDDIQSQVGTSVTVRPAGSFGGGFVDRGDNNGGGANGGGATRGEQDKGEKPRARAAPPTAPPPPPPLGRQSGGQGQPHSPPE